MGKTAAERQRECRKRRKEAGLEGEMRKKDRERKSLKKKILSNYQIKKLKLSNRMAQHRFRLKKKLEAIAEKHDSTSSDPSTSNNSSAPSPSAPYSPYKTRQSFGKAFQKVHRSLPKSPRKCLSVVKQLAKEFPVPVPTPLQENKKSQSTSVQEFYSLDNISWLSPGSKDFVIKKEGGNKFKIQKRYMLMTLKEAHSHFVEAHPEIKCSLSLFCSLRPIHVQCVANTPHTMCTCRYHENMRMLLKALAQSSNETPTDFKSFLSIVVCYQNSQTCMFSTCNKCVEGFSKYTEQFTERQLHIQWNQWDASGNRPVKEKQEGTVQDCLDLVKQQLPFFKMHTFIKRQQHCIFLSKKRNL